MASAEALMALADYRSWSYFFGTFRGKDKFARLLSYGSRGLGHYWGSNSTTKLGNEISLHRKTLKLFKWIVDFRKAVDAWQEGKGAHGWDRVRILGATAAHGFYVPYELANNMLWQVALTF
jgi:hypothetical protein